MICEKEKKRGDVQPAQSGGVHMLRSRQLTLSLLIARSRMTHRAAVFLSDPPQSQH